MDEAARGASALAAADFPLAITHYTKAIAINPQAVDYYIKRSIAYTRLSPAEPAVALKDTETAVLLANKRGKRELIAQSQLRRGIALFALERWADAKQCFDWVRKIDEKEKSLQIWGAKVQGKLDGLGDDDERRKPTVKEIPDIDLPKVAKPAPPPVAAPKVEAKSTIQGVQTPASHIRHEWYQTSDTIVVNLFAKGIPKETATIDIQQDSVSISFPLPTGSDFHFSLDPLYANIDITSSTSKIMATKAELTLKKVVPGLKWPSIEGTETSSDKTTVSTDDADESAAVKPAVPKIQASSSGPLYPTSSKSGPKNWDKVVETLKKKPKKAPKDGKDGDDSDSQQDDGIDSDEGDGVNGFFSKLYKDAGPDQKRAMMKSYQESNGTALSTDWNEVKRGTVETTPPEGMVAKKW
ncbi:hypothetical protein MMC07_003608 [Pseudocyphellaria aurata]|nr:hypothetical protein [Pseudocyphellaria aurata]